MTTPHPSIPRSPPEWTPEDESASDIYGALIEIASGASSASDYYQRSFRAIAVHFGTALGLLTVRGQGGDIEDRYTAGDDDRASPRWSAVAEALLIETQTGQRAQARLYRARANNDASTDDDAEVQVIAMSALISDDHGRPRGAIALLTRCASPADGESMHSEFRALAALVSGRVPDGAVASAKARETALTRGIQRAARYASLQEFAFAITNNLRNKIGCEQVALGVARGRSVNLLAISGFDEIKRRSPGTIHVRQAMEECLDAGEPLICQLEDKWSHEPLSTGHRLHRRWHTAASSAAVASIPLLVDGVCVAVISVRRDRERPFTADELDTVRNLVEPLAPSLTLVERAGRSLPGHAKDRVAAGARWLVAPTGWGRKALLLAFVGFMYWFVYGTTTHRITVACTIQPHDIREFAAPIEGVIAAVHVQPGDRVQTGDPLVTFDTGDLELEAERLWREIRVFSLEEQYARGAGDVAGASLAEAERRVLEAQLALVDRQIERAVVRATDDGIILDGDLRGLVGQVMQQGAPLLAAASDDVWTIELELPQSAAPWLGPGATGRFRSHARPDAPQDCTLTRIRPRAEAKDGKVVFLAEGELAAPDAAWLRPGVAGVAKIDAGPKPVWWVALHRVIDRLRMRFWL